MKNFIVGTLLGAFAGFIGGMVASVVYFADSRSNVQLMYKNDLKMRERNAFKDGARSYAAGEGIFTVMDTGEAPEKWMTNKVDNSTFKIKA